MAEVATGSDSKPHFLDHFIDEITTLAHIKPLNLPWVVKCVEDLFIIVVVISQGGSGGCGPSL